MVGPALATGWWTTGRTLHDRFDPRSNCLSVLRLALATTVAVVHAQTIGWGDQPALGHTRLGDLMVDGFFVISGFLVTRSALRLPTLRRFVWHRALRILPGFWTCLVVTALLVAPVLARLQGLPALGVLTGQDPAPGYVARNAALLVRQWDIARLNTGANDQAMNGALWTLFYEALCYLAVGTLVAVGLLRRTRRRGLHRAHRAPTGHDDLTAVRLARQFRAHALLFVTVAVWAAYSGQLAGILPASPAFIGRLLWMFLLGALGHVYARRIRFTRAGAAVAATTLLASITALDCYQSAGGPGFAYLLLWTVVGLPLRWEPPVDLSYGMYVYHWPTELVLHGLGLTGAGRLTFTATAILAVSAVSAASWYLVEAPALRHKDAPWVDGRRQHRPRSQPFATRQAA